MVNRNSERSLINFIRDKRTRFDYFLVWGHATKYIDDIIRIIKNSGFLNIRLIIKHTPRNNLQLINVVYSFDYAPIDHLREKSKYLLKNGIKPVYFVIVENKDVNEQYVDTGEFRHIECLSIKKVKNEIRDIFNDRLENRRSENHVVHASDNELQTHYVMKYLGFNNGTEFLKKYSNKIIKSPAYIDRFKSFDLKRVKIDDLVFNKNVGKAIKEFKIIDMPQYRALLGEKDVYDKYILKYRGLTLIDNHNYDNLKKLFSNFEYLDSNHSTNYVLTVQKENGKYLVVDGSHRSAVLKKLNRKELIIAVIKNGKN